MTNPAPEEESRAWSALLEEVLQRYRTDARRSFGILLGLAVAMELAGWVGGISADPLLSRPGQDSPLSLGPLGIGVFCGATFWVWYGLTRKLPYWEQELRNEESPGTGGTPFRTTFPPRAQLFEIRRLREAIPVMVSFGLLLAAFPLLVGPWASAGSPLNTLGLYSTELGWPYPTLFFAALIAVAVVPTVLVQQLAFPSLRPLERRVGNLSERPIPRARNGGTGRAATFESAAPGPASAFDQWNRSAEAMFRGEVLTLWAVLGCFALGLLGVTGLSATISSDSGGFGGLVPFPYSLLGLLGWPLAVALGWRSLASARRGSPEPSPVPGSSVGEAGEGTPTADGLASFYRLANRVLAVQRLTDAVLWVVLFATIWLAFLLGSLDPFNGFRGYGFPGYDAYVRFWTAEGLLSAFLVGFLAYRFHRLLDSERVQLQVQRAADALDRLEREFWSNF